jgi:transposase-like protein
MTLTDRGARRMGPKLHSINGLERLNKEVKQRADVVGIFPNEASIIRLVGAVLMEANDEWQLQHRYLSIEALAEISADDSGEKYTRAPPAAAPIITPRAA